MRVSRTEMHRYFRSTVSLLLLSSICSCSVYQSQFDCPPGKGAGCVSVSTVNDLVNMQALDDFIDEKEDMHKRRRNGLNNARDLQESYCDKCPANPSHSSNQATAHRQVLSKQRIAKNKIQEKVTIWFKERRDERGILHKEHEKQLSFKAKPHKELKK